MLTLIMIHLLANLMFLEKKFTFLVSKSRMIIFTIIINIL